MIEAASSDFQKAVKLFQGTAIIIKSSSTPSSPPSQPFFIDTDTDGSGQLDIDEFGELLVALGLDLTPERLREV
jgi:hypothetical protein